ncbi:autolysin [Companilactobacillus allii]|uniref:ArpU family phage packaging/lysis transcriptional regulator n=1 Tax=Companilactobacillus allii TaxID=1847728 RepID=UPI0012FFA88E|nr:ArpU family phage packaging/lysis transcriptional regulator [Companilactobacillus allii]USQ67663.1 autolysin [Companilactobacillus allii]
MFLIPEYDESKCKNNVRPILNQYRRLARIAGRSLTDLKSPTISDMPSATPYGNRQEENNSTVISARMELDEINRAMNNLSQECFEVVYLTYMAKEKFTDTKIAYSVFQSYDSSKSVERKRSIGLIQFCEAYRNGKLLVFKE